MEKLTETIMKLSDEHEYFSELNMNSKTHCWNFAKLHKKLAVYTTLLNDECTITYFFLMVLDKIPAKSKPRPMGHFTHLSHVQYQLDKKKRWEVVELIKNLESYRKNLKEVLYSSRVNSVFYNEANDTYEQVDVHLTIEKKDKIEAEYVAISNYIKINIDKIV